MQTLNVKRDSMPAFACHGFDVCRRLVLAALGFTIGLYRHRLAPIVVFWNHALGVLHLWLELGQLLNHPAP